MYFYGIKHVCNTNSCKNCLRLTVAAVPSNKRVFFNIIKKMWFSALVVVFSLGFVTSEPVSFEKYQVFSLIATNAHQLEVLRKLADTDGIDYWQSPTEVGRRIDVMVAPHRLSDFAKLSENLELHSQVMVDNVQR